MRRRVPASAADHGDGCPAGLLRGRLHRRPDRAVPDLPLPTEPARGHRVVATARDPRTLDDRSAWLSDAQGDYAVTVSFAGDDFYAATSATQTLRVLPPQIAIVGNSERMCSRFSALTA